MLPFEDLKNSYQEFPELIKNTSSLLDNCTIEFDFSQNTPNNQKSYTNNELLDYKLLEKLTYQGLHYRYKKSGERIFKRIEKELHIIKEKGFVSYFLINWKAFLKMCVRFEYEGIVNAQVIDLLNLPK